MSARDRIGDGRARASLAVARNLGVTIQFTHRDADPVSLKARVLGDRIESVSRGPIFQELRVLTLQISTAQAGFPVATDEAEPVTPGDLVEYLDREYAVLDPVEKNAQSTVYTLRCTERKRLHQG